MLSDFDLLETVCIVLHFQFMVVHSSFFCSKLVRFFFLTLQQEKKKRNLKEITHVMHLPKW